MTTAGVTTNYNFRRMEKCLRINAGKLERSSSICRLNLALSVLGGQDQSHNQSI